MKWIFGGAALNQNENILCAYGSTWSKALILGSMCIGHYFLNLKLLLLLLAVLLLKATILTLTKTISSNPSSPPVSPFTSDPWPQSSRALVPVHSRCLCTCVLMVLLVLLCQRQSATVWWSCVGPYRRFDVHTALTDKRKHHHSLIYNNFLKNPPSYSRMFQDSCRGEVPYILSKCSAKNVFYEVLLRYVSFL